jgi:hypothetical protein
MAKPHARPPLGLVVILARDSGRSEQKLKKADADVAHVDKEGNDLDADGPLARSSWEPTTREDPDGRCND